MNEMSEIEVLVAVKMAEIGDKIETPENLLEVLQTVGVSAATLLESHLDDTATETEMVHVILGTVLVGAIKCIKKTRAATRVNK